jgi:hypothetical protein
MKDGIIEFITAFMLLVIVIGIFALSVKWRASKSEKEFMTEISSYETISIEDKNYNTNEVVTVIYHIRGHHGDAYEIMLKDGTKIHFSADSYTLKDKR